MGGIVFICSCFETFHVFSSFFSLLPVRPPSCSVNVAPPTPPPLPLPPGQLASFDSYDMIHPSPPPYFLDMSFFCGVCMGVVYFLVEGLGGGSGEGEGIVGSYLLFFLLLSRSLEVGGGGGGGM